MDYCDVCNRALTTMTSYPTSIATCASVVRSRLKNAICSKYEVFIVHGTCAACAAVSANYHLTVKRLASIVDVISIAVPITSDTGMHAH